MAVAVAQKIRNSSLAICCRAAANQDFRAASRAAHDARHRRVTRSLPKALESRLYGPLSMKLGIKPFKYRGTTIRLILSGLIITAALAMVVIAEHMI